MAKTVAHRAADDGMGSSWRDGPVRRGGGHCVTPRPVPPPKVLTAADTSSEDADWQLRAPAGDDDSGTGGDEDDELEAPPRVTRGRGGGKVGLLGNEGAHGPVIMDLAPDGSVQAAIPGKRCGSCGAITTPLWRHGPDGPKTLCNACGVRDNRKKGRIQPPRNGKVTKPPSSSKVAAGAEGGAAVVPSPRPGCFGHRFPPVPDSWSEYLHIGFAKLRSGGGCNDLILSGHGVIYAAVACTFSEYYPGWTSKLLWLALIRSGIRGPLTHQHYSVDMFLATAVTVLVWIACERVYPAEASRLRARPAGAKPDRKGPLQWLLTALVFAVLGVLAIIIIVGGA